MLKFKITATAILAVIMITGCAQQNLKKMDELQLSIADKIINYNTKPFYSLQTNKQDCRVLIRVNDIPFAYTFFEDEGESLLLPINNILPQSGNQTISIEVYPKSMEQVLSNKAHVNVKLIYSPNGRDVSMHEYEMQKEFNLPEGLGDRKLPKYIINDSFQAKVPWSFESELDNAKDLAKVPDIEQKVVMKYKKLGDAIFNRPVEYLREVEKTYLRNWSCNYFTKKIVSENLDSKSEMFDINLKDREMGPIANYEMVLYHNNKLVILRNKENKSSILRVNYMEEGYGEKSSSGQFVILYMPANSNELQVW